MDHPVTDTGAGGVVSEGGHGDAILLPAALGKVGGAYVEAIERCPARGESHGSGMLVVIDLRDRSLLAPRLAEARGMLARHARIPAEVAVLVGALAGALAESGPLELGVSAWMYLRSLEACERAVASLDGPDTKAQRRDVKRALRHARWLLRWSAWSAWRDMARWRLVGVSLLVAGVAAVVAGGYAVVLNGALDSGALDFGGWCGLIAGMQTWTACAGTRDRRARELAAALLPGERALVSPMLSGWRQRRRSCLATDKRLCLAERARRNRPARIEQTIVYGQITAITQQQLTHGGTKVTRIDISAGRQSLMLEVSSDADALITILELRTGIGARPGQPAVPGDAVPHGLRRLRRRIAEHPRRKLLAVGGGALLVALAGAAVGLFASSGTSEIPGSQTSGIPRTITKDAGFVWTLQSRAPHSRAVSDNRVSDAVGLSMAAFRKSAGAPWLIYTAPGDRVCWMWRSRTVYGVSFVSGVSFQNGHSYGAFYDFTTDGEPRDQLCGGLGP
jgi:hypothetical protein